MAREEKIEKQAAKEQFDLYESLDWRAGFIAGANWADKTMIEKACEWLDNIDTDDYMDSGVFQMSDLIIDFKKQWNHETEMRIL